MAIGQLSLHLLLSVIKGYRYYSSILYVLLSVLWSCPWPSGRGQLHIVRRVLYKLAGTWYDKGLEGTIGSTGTYSMYSMIYRELETVPIPMFEQSEGKNCSASMCLWCESKELACSALPYQQSWARVIFFNESRVTALCCFTDASLVSSPECFTDASLVIGVFSTFFYASSLFKRVIKRFDRVISIQLLKLVSMPILTHSPHPLLAKNLDLDPFPEYGSSQPMPVRIEYR